MSDVTICKTCFCCGRGMIPINGEFVCDDCLSLTETRDEVIRLTARLAAAEARIIALRDAIKPFAEFAKLLDDFDDEHSVIRRKDWLVSDHRKAAAAYGDD